MKRLSVAQVAERSSVGTTALKNMQKAGINIQNHTEISNYILNKKSNHRPVAWRSGYVPEQSDRNTTEDEVEDLDALDLKAVNVKDELTKLNAMMAATNKPDTVDMLSKKISSLHKSVVTEEKLSGLVSQSEIDSDQQAAFSILGKFMQRLYLEMPASLVGLEVDKITSIIQEEVEQTMRQVIDKLESDE